MGAATEHMVRIPGGAFEMGSERFYPEERPVRSVEVDGFWMDERPVTAAEFADFVDETGYVTVAERPLDPSLYPGVDPALLVPGSLVFHATEGPVDLREPANWWAYEPGVAWREALAEDHPVTHVAYEDAEAYADWAGKSLPTEAEWERAARGGLEGAVFAWGDEEMPGGRAMANTWQGRFPWENLLTDGYAGTSPVGSFPANGYGLYDMTGNVWEWTADFFALQMTANACCVPRNPRVDSPEQSIRDGFPSRVIKGGSHLCAPNYCLRYRPAARQSEAIDTSTGHIGFRCVVREA